MLPEITNLLVAYPVLQILIIVFAMLIIICLEIKRDSIPKKIWLPLSIASGLVLGVAIISFLKSAGDNYVQVAIGLGLIVVVSAIFVYAVKKHT